MMSTVWKVAFLLLGIPLLLSANNDPQAEQDLKRMEGSWIVKRLEIAGSSSPANQRDKIRIVVEGNDLIVSGGDGSEVKNNIYLNPKVSPREIDLEPFRNQAPTARGIYQFTDTGILLCVSDNGTRPKSFTTSPKSGQVLMELEKVKE